MTAASFFFVRSYITKSRPTLCARGRPLILLGAADYAKQGRLKCGKMCVGRVCDRVTPTTAVGTCKNT